MAFPGHGSFCQPTSLNFINRPNPVEPQSAIYRHPLDVAQTSPSSPDRIRQRPTADTCREPSLKRFHPGNVQALYLPELPAFESGHVGVVGRANVGGSNSNSIRIPPTLTGLHQPPPNANLLPSISLDDPRPLAPLPPPTSLSQTTPASAIERPQPSDSSNVESQTHAFQARAPPSTKPARVPKVIRGKWSDDETACLLRGVARFGIGSWTKILQCDDYRFHDRTALQLKDRFRVCCPSEYVNLARREPVSAWTAKETTDLLRGVARFGVGNWRRIHQCNEYHFGRRSPLDLRDRFRLCHPDEYKRYRWTVHKSTSTNRNARCERRSVEDLEALGIAEPFVPSRRRNRKGYSSADDEHLRRGFEMYRNSWRQIQQDPDLGFASRTPTDLRDRFRQRFPDLYANAGLTPKASKPPKRPEPDIAKLDTTADENRQPVGVLSPSSRTQKVASEPSSTLQKPTQQSIIEHVAGPAPTDELKTSLEISKHSATRKTSFHDQSERERGLGDGNSKDSDMDNDCDTEDDSADDADDDDDENEDDDEDDFAHPTGANTLDRGILDWATSSGSLAQGSFAALAPRHSLTSITPSDFTRTTLEPRTTMHSGLTVGTSGNTQTGSAFSSLPSLAFVTAGAGAEEGDGGHESQLELPSLVGWESDQRHFLGFDELLS